MPVFDPHPDFLRQAIRSVLEQSLEDIELIVVEDPAERSAEPVVADMNDGRLRFIRNPERTSHVRQLNRALHEMRSDLAAHLDADDVCEPDRLERQHDRMRSHPDLSVLGSWISVVDAAGEQRGIRRYPVEHDQIVRAMRRYNPLAHSTVMYRKHAVLEAGGYEDRVYPAIDYDLWCRLARAGHRFANLPTPLVRYRLHPEGIKATQLQATIRASQQIKRMHWADQMDVRDRLRLMGESVLAHLPPSVVMRLFVRTQYAKS